MSESILGSTSSERVLLFLFAREEGYPREIARFFKTDLAPIQRQLIKLEINGVLSSRLAGRTRLYSLSPRYVFKPELEGLLAKALDFYSPGGEGKTPHESAATQKKRQAFMKPINEMSAGELAAFFQLVPKLHLGTKMIAKLSLAVKGVPKHSLGTRRAFPRESFRSPCFLHPS